MNFFTALFAILSVAAVANAAAVEVRCDARSGELPLSLFCGMR
jgi:hypothetical protein